MPISRPLNKPFEKEIRRIAKITWALHLDTPLCIRNGSQFAWNSTLREKARNDLIEFRWNEPKGNLHDLSDLNFVVQLEENRITPLYQVPASSLRGALRSWTINHLVQRPLWKKLSGSDQAKISMADVKQWIEQEKTGFALLTSLFGIALENVVTADDQAESQSYSHAGRLRVETYPFDTTEAKVEPAIDHFDLKNGNRYGPANVNRQVNLRGPVDRITHSAKEGGLHTFLEFSEGQVFRTVLSILNPEPEDLGLVALWEREMENGLLRLGAVNSVGRGRISVDQNSSFYKFYSLPNDDKLAVFFGGEMPNAQPSDDILSDLYEKRAIPWNKVLCSFYLGHLKRKLTPKGAGCEQ